MTTEVKAPGVSTPEVSAQELTLEGLGAMVGVPIVIKPWWGSRRYHKYWSGSGKLMPSYRKWQCAAGGDYYGSTDPHVDHGLIVVYQGQCGATPGKKSRTHQHRQRVTVLGVQHQAILIELAVGVVRYIRTQKFILGMDERAPYVAQVRVRVTTLEEAFEDLKPPEVIKAEAKGLEVKRQGDWFFIPLEKYPRLDTHEFTYEKGRRNHFLYQRTFPPTPSRHRAQHIVHSAYGRHLVKGTITAPDHEPLVLKRLHFAVRNNAIRSDARGLD